MPEPVARRAGIRRFRAEDARDIRSLVAPELERSGYPSAPRAAIDALVDGADSDARALVAMDYPHDTWVLDEGGDKRVRALCTRLGARYFTRKGRRRFHNAAPPAETSPLPRSMPKHRSKPQSSVCNG